jgi:hypothetical protein
MIHSPGSLLTLVPALFCLPCHFVYFVAPPGLAVSAETLSQLHQRLSRLSLNSLTFSHSVFINEFTIHLSLEHHGEEGTGPTDECTLTDTTRLEGIAHLSLPIQCLFSAR